MERTSSCGRGSRLSPDGWVDGWCSVRRGDGWVDGCEDVRMGECVDVAMCGAL